MIKFNANNKYLTIDAPQDIAMTNLIFQTGLLI